MNTHTNTHRSHTPQPRLLSVAGRTAYECIALPAIMFMYHNACLSLTFCAESTSENSRNAKRIAELGSAQIRQSMTGPHWLKKVASCSSDTCTFTHVADMQDALSQRVLSHPAQTAATHKRPLTGLCCTGAYVHTHHDIYMADVDSSFDVFLQSPLHTSLWGLWLSV